MSNISNYQMGDLLNYYLDYKSFGNRTLSKINCTYSVHYTPFNFYIIQVKYAN